jgi:hypothetical protein
MWKRPYSSVVLSLDVGWWKFHFRKTYTFHLDVLAGQASTKARTFDFSACVRPSCPGLSGQSAGAVMVEAPYKIFNPTLRSKVLSTVNQQTASNVAVHTVTWRQQQLSVLLCKRGAAFRSSDSFDDERFLTNIHVYTCFDIFEMNLGGRVFPWLKPH